MQTEALWRIWKLGDSKDCFAELADEDKYESSPKNKTDAQATPKQERKELRTALFQDIDLRHLFASACRGGMGCVLDSNSLTMILDSECMMQYIPYRKQI